MCGVKEALFLPLKILATSWKKMEREAVCVSQWLPKFSFAKIHLFQFKNKIA